MIIFLILDFLSLSTVAFVFHPWRLSTISWWNVFFFRKPWAMVLNGVQLTLPLQSSVKYLYLAWDEHRPSKNRATVLHKFWHSILKINLWSLWISRNNCVFNNQRLIFQFVASKVLALISESIGCPPSSFPSSLHSVSIPHSVRMLKPVSAPS